MRRVRWLETRPHRRTLPVCRSGRAGSLPDSPRQLPQRCVLPAWLSHCPGLATRDVAMRPGTTMLAVIPSLATSRASVFDQPTSDSRSAFEIARLGMGDITPEDVLVMNAAPAPGLHPGENAVRNSNHGKYHRLKVCAPDSRVLTCRRSGRRPASVVDRGCPPHPVRPLPSRCWGRPVTGQPNPRSDRCSCPQLPLSPQSSHPRRAPDAGYRDICAFSRESLCDRPT